MIPLPIALMKSPTTLSVRLVSEASIDLKSPGPHTTGQRLGCEGSLSAGR